MDAFKAYAICFGTGVLFTLISAVASHLFGGHAETSGGDVPDGHVESGLDSDGTPGFARVSPATLAAFVAAFGGFGMILSQIDVTSKPWISAPLSVVGGLAVAGLVVVLLRSIFKNTQSSSEGHVSSLAGLGATVISPIPANGVGEIAYVQGGSRYSAPDRRRHGDRKRRRREDFPNCRHAVLRDRILIFRPHESLSRNLIPKCIPCLSLLSLKSVRSHSLSPDSSLSSSCRSSSGLLQSRRRGRGRR